MIKNVYGDDCISRRRIHEWFKRCQEGREALENDGRSGRPNEENAQIVREFIRKEPKSSLKSELGIYAASIYRILTENSGY